MTELCEHTNLRLLVDSHAGDEHMPLSQDHFPAPQEGFVLTHFITSRDVERAAAFYRDVLGGEVVTKGEPTVVKLANGWIIINVGGGPTDDKPDVVLEPPHDPHKTSSFLNIRVANIQKAYEEIGRASCRETVEGA